MNNQRVQSLVSFILHSLKEETEPVKELEKILINIKDPITNKDISENEKDKIKYMVENDLSFKMQLSEIEILKPSSLQDQRLHKEWYEEWLREHSTNHDRYYWICLKNHLSKILREKYNNTTAANIIKSTDIATDLILSSMESPHRKIFSSKGLVIGHVQSGKTANFTALIAKAVDCGYKMIIVLAGLHDVLRTQTQIRLDKELTGINDIDLPNNEFVKLPPALRRWERLTNESLNVPGEFTQQGRDPFNSIMLKPNPIVAVIKKNVRVMEKLSKWISETSSESERSLMPLLVIDDEADQASINTRAGDPNSEATRTNKEIRKLLKLFKRNAYIAYTATPFANFFIDKDAMTDDLYADLYPRNFIHSLPEPKGYYGSARIFNSESYSSHVKITYDSGQILPSEESPETEIVESLENAILAFFIGCSVRILRGDKMEPMSMLIHLSHRIIDQSEIYKAVSNHIANLALKIKSGPARQEVKEKFKDVWVDFNDSSMVIIRELELDYNIFYFDQVWSNIDDLIKNVSILELNSSSDDDLNYNKNPGLRVIAIGGNKLSRGLTLEGLMCSYFTRNAGGYDTLLQMGRWFGFRRNYEDLTRLFTTLRNAEYFSHLSLVEEEVRNSISRYEEEGVTPDKFPVLVQGHKNLNVTARNKLGSAEMQQNGFNGSVTQNTKFPLDDPDKLKANLDLTTNLIHRLKDLKEPEKIADNYLWKDIDSNIPVEYFLQKYYEKDSGLNLPDCITYIKNRMLDGELIQWSIGVISKNIEDNPTLEWAGLQFSPVERSRLIKPPGIYNVGAVDERRHRRFDLEDGEERSTEKALMNIYRISKDSKAYTDKRVPLYHGIKTEKVDLIGVAIILPVSNNAPYGWLGQIF